MINLLPKYIALFFGLVLIQVLIINNIQVTYLEVAPTIFILFVLLLPFETPRWVLLLSAFFIGITTDIFSDSLGLNAGAAVFSAFLRPLILRFISLRDGYEIGTLPTFKYYGFSWVLKYTFILVFAFNIFYYFAEAFSFNNVFTIFLKIIIGTLFTTSIIVISQLLFKK